MKKFILIILFIFMLTGCNNGSFKPINCNELIQKIEAKESFIVLFTDETNNGELLKENLNKVLKSNNLTAYLINTNNISSDQKNKLRQFISYENLSIVFIKNGIDPSVLTHITDAETPSDTIEKHLTNLDFIKK